LIIYLSHQQLAIGRRLVPGAPLLDYLGRRKETDMQTSSGDIHFFF
jgi:hypothetical protein